MGMASPKDAFYMLLRKNVESTFMAAINVQSSQKLLKFYYKIPVLTMPVPVQVQVWYRLVPVLVASVDDYWYDIPEKCPCSKNHRRKSNLSTTSWTILSTKDWRSHVSRQIKKPSFWFLSKPQKKKKKNGTIDSLANRLLLSLKELTLSGYR